MILECIMLSNLCGCGSHMLNFLCSKWFIRCHIVRASTLSSQLCIWTSATLQVGVVAKFDLVLRIQVGTRRTRANNAGDI